MSGTGIALNYYGKYLNWSLTYAKALRAPQYLQTRDVSYDAKKQLIYSDSDIKITKDKDVMYGKGFESDTDLKNIVIKKQRIIID